MIKYLLACSFVLLLMLISCDNGSESTTPLLDSPETPVIDSIKAGNERISLFWGSVPTAVSYNVYSDTATGVNKESFNISGQKVTYHTRSNLTNGKEYFFKVAAVGSDGQVSELSNEVSATPHTDTIGTPTGFTAIGSDGLIKLSWKESNGADSYTIYWSVDSGVTESSSKIENIKLLNYVHSDLTNDKQYFYRISAHAADSIQSSLSKEISAKPTAKSDDKGDGKGDVKPCDDGAVYDKGGVI